MIPGDATNEDVVDDADNEGRPYIVLASVTFDICLIFMLIV